MSLLWTLLVLVAALAVVAPLTRVLGRNTGWPLAGLYLASWVAFLPAIREVLGGGETTWSVPWVPELGVDLAFRADGLGVVFGSIALLIGAVAWATGTVVPVLGGPVVAIVLGLVVGEVAGQRPTWRPGTTFAT